MGRPSGFPFLFEYIRRVEYESYMGFVLKIIKCVFWFVLSIVIEPFIGDILKTVIEYIYGNWVNLMIGFITGLITAILVGLIIVEKYRKQIVDLEKKLEDSEKLSIVKTDYWDVQNAFHYVSLSAGGKLYPMQRKWSDGTIQHILHPNPGHHSNNIKECNCEKTKN